MTQKLKMVGLMGWAAASANHHGWRKGPWTTEEDKLLTQHVASRGDGRWSSVARCAGLNRSGKSCRLRWVNYLRPGLKKGQITPQEESVIIELHAIWGNKWSTIARYLPGRTDNEIKNYWRTHFRKKEKLSRKSLLARRKLQKLKLKPQPQLQPPDQPLPMELPASSSSSSTEQSLTVPTSSWMDGTCHDQDGSWWGGLWNVADHQGPVGMDQIQQLQQQGDQYCCKMALSAVQNDHATTNYNIISNANNNNNNNGFSWGGDLISNFNYNGGCIF